MVLFAKSKRDPVEQAERNLADIRAAHAKLADRLNAAETSVAEKRAAAERVAIAGASDEALDRAEAEMRAAADREQTLRAALAKLDEQVADAEQALAAAVDRRDRDLVADHLEQLATGIAAAYPKFNDAGAELLRAIAEPQSQIPEAAGLANFLNNTRHEVAAACNLLDQELRFRATQIRGGSGTYRIQHLIVTKHASPEGETEVIAGSGEDQTSAE